MTAASVLSLCMSLIARSPPDSSRSPHKLSPPPTPPPPSRRPPTPQRLPRPRARSLSSSRSSPVRHRRPRRTPPRVCTYAQADEHPRTQKCRCWYVAQPAARPSLPLRSAAASEQQSTSAPGLPPTSPPVRGCSIDTLTPGRRALRKSARDCTVADRGGQRPLRRSGCWSGPRPPTDYEPSPLVCDLGLVLLAHPASH